MNIVLALLSTLFLVLSVPPFNLPFIYIALVPLLIVAKRGRLKEVLFLSGITGILYFLAILWPLTSLTSWWWKSSTSYFWLYREYIIYGTVILGSMFAGLVTFVPFFYILQGLKKLDWRHYIILPTIWIGFEAVRIIFVFGFGWGTFGYLVYARNILHLLPLVSVFGLSFLVIVANLLISELFFCYQEKNWSEFKKKTIVFSLIFVLCFGMGELEVVKKKNSEGERSMTVALIAPNLTTIETTSTVGATKYFSLLAKSLKYSPNIIILPENALPFLKITEKNITIVSETESGKTVANDLIDISKTASSTSIIIGMRTEKENSRFNSVVVIENGKIVDIYHKQKLLPFAENTPQSLRSIHVDPLSTESDTSYVKTKYGDIDVRICSEVFYTSPNPKTSSIFLAHISNDTIFKSPSVRDWTDISAKYLAVKNNTYVLRSAKGDASEIIGPLGNTFFSEKVEDGLLIGKIPVR